MCFEMDRRGPKEFVLEAARARAIEHAQRQIQALEEEARQARKTATQAEAAASHAQAAANHARIALTEVEGRLERARKQLKDL